MTQIIEREIYGETVRMEVHWDDALPERLREQANRVIENAFERKRREMQCQREGHEMREIEHGADIPWDAICDRCHWPRPA